MLADRVLDNKYPASLYTSVASDSKSRDVTGVFSRLRSRIPTQPCYLRARLVHGRHTQLADDECDDRALRIAPQSLFHTCGQKRWRTIDVGHIVFLIPCVHSLTCLQIDCATGSPPLSSSGPVPVPGSDRVLRPLAFINFQMGLTLG